MSTSDFPPLRAVLRPTTLIEAPRLGRQLDLDVLLASETFQYTGSFKFRAAYNVAVSVANKHLIAASSGNFGQALAYACQKLGKTCTIVMPGTSAQVKVDAVREYGGQVDLIDVQTTTRKARVAALAQARPEAYAASAYDDPLVIAGNATLGEELAALPRPVDCILAPVGGGGLIAGIITGLRTDQRHTPVIGVEPLVANDAARSLRAGRLLANAVEPLTIADGVRTLSLGQHNWAVIKDGVSRIIEVTEDQIRQAVRMLFVFANLKTEPTGALSLAALLAEPDSFRHRSICCVISGGNVDPGLFRQLLVD